MITFETMHKQKLAEEKLAKQKQAQAAHGHRDGDLISYPMDERMKQMFMKSYQLIQK
ncbi:MAG: hypothetical protein SOY70_07500 [Veillonellaceae bacterium]|nr:hypothetical protein [Veillonellaceae bacterium]